MGLVDRTGCTVPGSIRRVVVMIAAFNVIRASVSLAEQVPSIYGGRFWHRKQHTRRQPLIGEVQSQQFPASNYDRPWCRPVTHAASPFRLGTSSGFGQYRATVRTLVSSWAATCFCVRPWECSWRILAGRSDGFGLLGWRSFAGVVAASGSSTALGVRDSNSTVMSSATAGQDATRRAPSVGWAAATLAVTDAAMPMAKASFAHQFASPLACLAVKIDQAATTIRPSTDSGRINAMNRSSPTAEATFTWWW